ncbi:hypothetical protein [Paracoccus sp. SY]|uniref:hypothetical protein n=1 Tax=Paracoccus sp. SY TaxID=1330255 RepID=UPI000CD0826C|nr:hypothetical protein [Paracoccus sp. SY]
MLKPLAASLLLVSPAFGSSEDAWSDFATEVESACLAATKGSISEGSAVVDPFGSESYGLAIVSGVTPDDAAVSMICIVDKESRAVEIGGELEITVMELGLQPLTADDIEGAGLTGELFCSFEANGQPLLLAAGNVASDQAAEATIRLSNRLLSLSADGGYDAMTPGTVFTGSEVLAEVAVTSEATESGESAAYPAKLTVQPEGGDKVVADGLWRCGP